MPSDKEIAKGIVLKYRMRVVQKGHFSAEWLEAMIAQALQEAREEMLKECEKEVEKSKPVGGGGEFYDGLGGVYSKAWDKAHDKILTVLKNLKP